MTPDQYRLEGARAMQEAAMHLLSEYDAPNPVDDAVSKLRTALAACKGARDALL